jgi:hypothetical protein
MELGTAMDLHLKYEGGVVWGMALRITEGSAGHCTQKKIKGQGLRLRGWGALLKL